MSKNRDIESKRRGIFAALWILLAALFLISCALGRYFVSPVTIIKILLSKLFAVRADWAPEAETVLFEIRLPRIAAAVLVGAALSAAGAAYQGLFRNPLVSPDILGVSAGSGFGAALAIFFSFNLVLTNISAFCFGIATALLVGLVAGKLKGDRTLALVLVGIIAGSLLQSATSFLKLVADPTNVLPAITYWLMGSLASVRAGDLVFAAPVICFSLFLLWLGRWRLNSLTMGEDEARALGTDVGLMQALVIAGATLATAASVAISGMIGWVGLVIPQLGRMLVGNDYRRLLPASMLMGAGFLVAVDDLSRLLTTSEIPIGILTSFVGAPFFLILATRRLRTV